MGCFSMDYFVGWDYQCISYERKVAAVISELLEEGRDEIVRGTNKPKFLS